jgi:hypothetical protein
MAEGSSRIRNSPLAAGIRIILPGGNYPDTGGAELDVG